MLLQTIATPNLCSATRRRHPDPQQPLSLARWPAVAQQPSPCCRPHQILALFESTRQHPDAGSLGAQSHAFHMAFTAVIALAFYQTVIAIARNESESLGFWTGVLMTCAVGVLLMPILAIPFIFGGIAAKPLALESKKALNVRKVEALCPDETSVVRSLWRASCAC